MPAMATRSCAFRYSGSEPSVRQLLSAYDQAAGVDPGRFLVLGGNAGVADMGIGQGDKLLIIGGIGKDFLVTGHGRVENDFPLGPAVRADGLSVKQAAVFQGQQGCMMGQYSLQVSSTGRVMASGGKSRPAGMPDARRGRLPVPATGLPDARKRERVRINGTLTPVRSDLIDCT